MHAAARGLMGKAITHAERVLRESQVCPVTESDAENDGIPVAPSLYTATQF